MPQFWWWIPQGQVEEEQVWRILLVGLVVLFEIIRNRDRIQSMHAWGLEVGSLEINNCVQLLLFRTAIDMHRSFGD